jgi:hypothetical protein
LLASLIWSCASCRRYFHLKISGDKNDHEFRGQDGGSDGCGLGLRAGMRAHWSARGMNLVLVDVQQEALDKAEAELKAAGAKVLARRVDVSDAAQMERLAAEVKRPLVRRTLSSTTRASARAAWSGKTRWPTGNGCWASMSGA